ncbi:hypothetical protein VTP01DRAFT_7860 [Rhizomucor pusillus]|uniref:uncharacterized protein n=1 Tax=Rhizomucor pusillus TaxID=4840 RepID=UPI003743CFDF
MSEKPHDHRALYKRNSIPRTQEQLRERHILLDESLRKKHREQLITAKRFRNLTRREERESIIPEPEIVTEHDEDIDPYYRLTPAQVEDLKNDLKSSDKESRLEAAHYIAKFVLEPAQVLIDYITQGDCIESLTRMLSSSDPEEQLQAAKTISDIAAGPYDLWIKSISTVPYMITLLASDNASLAEAAALALGNMAAEDLGQLTTEDDEVRAQICNNGAIPPLIKLLNSNDSRLIQTACFTLANLARGQEKQMVRAGISEALFRHMKDKTSDTVTEVCWVMSYLCAGSEDFKKELIGRDIHLLLVENFQILADQGPTVLPVLRTLGHLASGSDDDVELLLDQDNFLYTLLQLTHSEQHAIRKESLWVLSNITTTERPENIRKVVDGNALTYIVDIIVQHTAFDIRQGAATCLMNIALHGEHYINMLPHKDLLPAFLELIRSQDVECMRVGLSYVEMLLTRVPRGNEIIETTPACMETLGSVNPSPDQELYEFANKLVDKFYNDNPALAS